jgi:putative aminopeptidase FrvX
MNKKSREFLYRYLNSSSPVGHEQVGQQVWLDYVEQFIDTKLSDAYGSVVGIINPKATYKVVIEAHADEISWLVSRITEDGYIYVVRNGGSDHQIAPSMRVNVYGDQGVVKGVFGWPAIHVRHDEKELTPTVKNLFVDVGAESKKEVEAAGVHIGSVITMEGELFKLGKNYLTGRALDDRIGGFIIAEVARKIKDEGDVLPFGLYLVNAVQEEVGCRGAAMISRRLKPDVALCVDVAHDTKSPLYKPEHGDLKCGLGPVLSYGAPVQNNLLRLIETTAHKAKIKFQRVAASGSTGTDTDSFAYASEGIASALISLPLKYMHTTVETLHKDDVESTIELLYHTLLNIKNGQDFRYLKL